ncbi:MAG: FtsW/RodA/SpoVE family cell cycle protein [Holosporales bacterium]
MSLFARTDNSALGRWWWTVDRWILAALGVLMILGLLLNMAAGSAVAERIHLEATYFVKRHFLYLIPTLALLIGASLLSAHDIRRTAFVLYAGCLVLLVLTPLVGTEIKGARRWISFLGFSLQPSEFVKPALSVLVAWMLAEAKRHPSFPGYLASFVFYGLVIGLLLLQPDMGQSILITAVYLSQCFLAGLPLYLIGAAVALGAAGLVSAYFLFPHVATRMDRFLNTDAGDKFSDRYQITQSLDAFVSGGLWGQGPGEGVVKKHLPDAHADFIFPVAAEEYGLILCVLIVLLYGFVVLRSLSRVLQDNGLFALFAVSGLVVQFGLQALINMASTLSLIPTKGMTLPFISFGGSSMLALAIGMGFVLGLTRRRGRGEVDL